MSIARALVLIGALNWGLIGFFRFDLVGALFGGQTSFISRIIYCLIGISAVVVIAGMATDNRERRRVD
jgi:hypothetical protein